MNFYEVLKLHRKLKVRLTCDAQTFVGTVTSVQEEVVLLETVYYNGVKRTYLRTEYVSALEELKDQENGD